MRVVTRPCYARPRRLIPPTDAAVAAIGHDRGMRLPWKATGLRGFADVAVPWGVGLFYVLVALGESDSGAPTGVVLLLLALAVVQGIALRWRRTEPLPVTAVSLLVSLAVLAISPDSVMPLGAYFAVGALASVLPPRVSLFGLALLTAVASINFVATTAEDAFFAIGLGVGAWALGEAARNRRVVIHEEARRAVADEQARIAREVHDVVAHSVSVIVVQAAAADDVFDEYPGQARDALRSIEHTGRDALRELRLLLGAMRPAGDGAEHAPAPGLERLDELAEPLRAGGLDVVMRREGDGDVPAGVDLSAYRIVQEALTNTLRHARATRAEVVLRLGPAALEVDVRDNGRPSVALSEGGHGLVGMRERATMLGGTFEAGPLPEGGYRVHARLPLEAAQ
jgi:signal transduction histidine kinase